MIRFIHLVTDLVRPGEWPAALAIGFPVGATAYFFGGWDQLFQTLMILVILDLISGVSCAFVQKDLASRDFLRGIIKKFGYVLAVMLAVRADALLPQLLVAGVEVSLRTMLIWAFVGGEMLSVAENLATMGVPLPPWFVEKLRGFGDGSER